MRHSAFSRLNSVHWGDQGAAEVSGWVPFGSPGCNGKAEHGANGASHAGRGLMPPALLDLSQRVKDFRCFDLGDRPLAKLLVGKV
jgi:hypothetical protein